MTVLQQMNKFICEELKLQEDCNGLWHCIAKPTFSASKLDELLDTPNPKSSIPSKYSSANYRYLTYLANLANLAVNGKIDSLLSARLSYGQACRLSKLTKDEITKISEASQELLFQTDEAIVKALQNPHPPQNVYMSLYPGI